MSASGTRDSTVALQSATRTEEGSSLVGDAHEVFPTLPKEIILYHETRDLGSGR
jgi:hypothetical protein